MFRKLCGIRALQNVVVVTNRWGEANAKIDGKHEEELMRGSDFFKPALVRGAQMARHENTVLSAEKIIRLILGNHPLPLRIQEELVKENKSISETGAGEELNRVLHAQIKKHQEEMFMLREKMERATKDKDEEVRRGLEREIEGLREEVIRASENEKARMREKINNLSDTINRPGVLSMIEPFIQVLARLLRMVLAAIGSFIPVLLQLLSLSFHLLRMVLTTVGFFLRVLLQLLFLVLLLSR